MKDSVEFKKTGCRPVDNVLKMVEIASARYHSTTNWDRSASCEDFPEDHPEEPSHIEYIEMSARRSARNIQEIEAQCNAAREWIKCQLEARSKSRTQDPCWMAALTTLQEGMDKAKEKAREFGPVLHQDESRHT